MCLNRVQLIGNLGTDPERRATPNGTYIVTFRVPTNEKWKDGKDGEIKSKTEWHRVVLFGEVALKADHMLSKGKQVFIEGKLRTRRWTDKNGLDRYSTEIVASDFKILGKKADYEPEVPTADATPSVAPYQDEDMPF